MDGAKVVSWMFESTVGNIVRMLKVIRTPRTQRGPVSLGFVGTVAITLVYGLVMLFSASYSSGYSRYGNIYYFIAQQAPIALIGFGLMILISFMNYRALRYANQTLMVLSVILLVAALFSPEDANGCRRWVYMFGGSLQPSELAKFALILFVADYIDRHYNQRKDPLHSIIIPAIPLVGILVLLYLEPHHSAMILMILIFGTMLVCGGCALRWIPVLGGLGGAVMIWMLSSRQNYVATRLGGVWGLNPGDTSEMLWQTKQSIYAISSGGLFGVGIGNSVQKHQWLPYAENDFIFSIVCEELGFVGALALIALFAVLIVQGLLIALRAPDFFGSMLGIGIVSQVAWQVFCHIGVATALLPNTGISLPFFSSGGTSLLLLLCEMGVLLSISRAGNARILAVQEKEKEEMERRIGTRRTRQVYRRPTL